MKQIYYMGCFSVCVRVCVRALCGGEGGGTRVDDLKENAKILLSANVV